MMSALMLMAFTAGANAECALNIPSYIARSSCIRDFKAVSANEIRLTDIRSEMARVLGAAGDSEPRATEPESTVARSFGELPWTDSHDWINNPPEWMRDIREDRRRGAPLPLMHLWRSQQTQTLIALGVSHRGVPGLYITRNLP
jgi:hypothetical protein